MTVAAGLAVPVVVSLVASASASFRADALRMAFSPGRRSVLQAGGATAAALIAPNPCGAEPGGSGEERERERDDDEVRNTFRSFSYDPKRNKKEQASPSTTTTIQWDPPDQDFSRELRYSASTLSDKEEVVPQPRCSGGLPAFPSWMEGHWLCTYKFEGASFPRGRDELSLKVPGAGLGTCAVLPNVGFNPAPFVQRFVSVSVSAFPGADADATVVEDVAYNLPRKLEAFWPQAKVTAVRVSTQPGGSSSSLSSSSSLLSPPCLVTGDGCAPEENPELHGPYATRCRMDYEGPTRTGGFRSQHLDLSMIDHSSAKPKSSNSASNNYSGDDDFLVSRSFVQYNVEQELTGYYREFVSFDRQQPTLQQQQQQQSSPSAFSWLAPSSTPEQGLSNGKLRGRTRVAAFLPGSSEAVALYSYTMRLYSITGEEAMLY